ncbi:hypothetical protein SAMN05216223_113147 [Actinacidiphila yanglinensis]|uniref:Pectate lyase superfamily protein n=1 Tax=Actinacidiphila yanglinensis TaxID=310779 RepID=A0A1H6DCL5_9ACTN|nr:hypothetical protein [Actinacidiphila yanglinensis]SEG82435.1 hypothetical protein SAMN05216223_113147 [Actinacidiphila yanglinensis]
MSSSGATGSDVREAERTRAGGPATATGSALTRRPYAPATAVPVVSTAAPVAGAAGSVVPASTRSPAGHRPPYSPAHPPAEPDFGPHVRVFGPDTPVERIQAALDAVAAEQDGPGGKSSGYAFLFRPGDYDVDVRLGPRVSVAGLGLHPDDVTLRGAVRVDSEDEGEDRAEAGDGAPATFGRAAENLAFAPAGGTTRWAATAPLRRVHIRGRLQLHPRRGDFSGGGLIADSVVDGRPVDAARRQGLVRDGAVAGRPDPEASRVLAGAEGAPARAFPSSPFTATPYTAPAATPLSREKPFLYVDERGRYRVFLPGLRHGAAGASWAGGSTPGSSVPIDRFFVARPTDAVRTLNKALSQGRHLLLTPGVYRLTGSIRVKWSGTVVLGLGAATLAPQRGVVPMTVADARGVRIAGLVFEAGATASRALLEIGDRRGGRTDPRDPASVQDVFFRIGGAGGGGAAAALVVNSDNVLLDHVGAWCAGAGRTAGAAGTGVVVHGDDVVATGLFVAGFPKHDVVWNGGRGRIGARPAGGGRPRTGAVRATT